MWTMVLGGSVALILLSITLHFAVPGQSIKIPTIILSTIGGLVAGALLGLLGAVWYGEMAHREIYGDLYKGESPAEAAKRSAQNPGAAAGEPKNDAAPTVSGGPGGTNLGADYPGITKEAPKATPKEPEPVKEPEPAPK